MSSPVCSIRRLPFKSFTTKLLCASSSGLHRPASAAPASSVKCAPESLYVPTHAPHPGPPSTRPFTKEIVALLLASASGFLSVDLVAGSKYFAILQVRYSIVVDRKGESLMIG